LVAFFAALRFAGAFLAADLRFFAAIVFLLIEVLLTYGLGSVQPSACCWR
jgi:hypothetical protein